jgi:L-alanine-DL-glutamate epimerase-like enolase superfamily enzyme
MGKRLGVPVARLLGQARDRVPLCVVVGYVYDENDATLRRELEHAVALGARSVKMVVGSGSPERDAARVGLARSIIGPDRLLAVDAFRSFVDLDDALRRVRALQPHDLSFLEDPFSETLAPLAAELRRRTGMSIALGESLAGHRLVRGLLDADAGDVIRLDALVIGGVREFMAAAGLASAHGRPVATHVNTEIHVQFAAALPNLYAGGIEYMPAEFGLDTLHRLLRNRLEIGDGLMVVPGAPGFGMDWDWDAVRRFARG